MIFSMRCIIIGSGKRLITNTSLKLFHDLEGLRGRMSINPQAPLDDDATPIINHWRMEIGKAPVGDLPEWARLRKFSVAFLDSDHIRPAIASGWGELDLWGVYHGWHDPHFPLIEAQQRRHGAKGLVPFLCWMRLRAMKLSEVGPKSALILGESGSLAITRPTERGVMRPWWEAIEQ